jgi:hypothetical protein
MESLLLEGVFDIPPYQRSYSWERDQLEDFLEDLRYLPEDRTHFFGHIILQKDKEPYQTEDNELAHYRVVDGQQRLTTTLIFLHAARKLDVDVDAELADKDLVQLPDRPRLLPQDLEGDYFQDSVLGDSLLSDRTPAQKRLEQAVTFFETQLKELNVSVSVLVARLREDFQVNIVEVDVDSEAAAIFESINDRGKSLSSLEKTKSLCMYMQDRAGGRSSLRDNINSRFGRIYQELYVLEKGHDRVSDFTEDSLQQFHWGMYDGYDSNEYSNSRDTLKDRLHEHYQARAYDAILANIDDYTRGLRDAATAFDKLFRPSELEDSVEDRLSRLLELGRVANVMPVLMASYLSYDAGDLAEVISACETLVFRLYAIDRRRSDTGQGKLVTLAHDIHTSETHTIADTIRRLESITRDYTDNDRFERALRDPDFYSSVSSRDIRYLFHHYGQQLEAEDKEFVPRELSEILSSDFQVEHILAQQLDQAAIPESLEGEYEKHVHRLGNLTTASRYWNSTYGALPFAEKRSVPDSTSNREKAYENSTLKVQKVLADISDFDKSDIDDRTDAIVEFALEEWRLKTNPDTAPSVDDPTALLDGSAEASEQLSDAEHAVLQALVDHPGWALRGVHKHAAAYEESPIDWVNEWGSERTQVQDILHQFERAGLARLEQRSWYPAVAEES